MDNQNAHFVESVGMEIQELHQFFQNWFNGTIPVSEFTRFSRVIHPEFKLISPNGSVLSSEQVIELVKNGYKSSPQRKIWTELISLQNMGDVIRAIYYEFQIISGTQSKRISTAIFQVHLHASCTWLHVHETWVEQNP